MTATATRITTSDALLDKLAKIEMPTPTVISCYVRLDRTARHRRQYLVELVNRIRELERGFAERSIGAEDQRTIHADIEKVVRRLARLDDLPALAGVGVFACGAIDLFELVPLVRVHRNRIDVDTRPLMHELLDGIDEGLPRGFAVNGTRETLRALARGQVRELIVPDEGRASGFRCSETLALTATKADCRGSGQPNPVPNLIDHVIEDALRHGSRSL